MVPCRQVIFSSVLMTIMDLRVPADIESKPLPEWSVISNSSRNLAVFINYIT